MRRSDSELLDDIAEAVYAIRSHLEYGPVTLAIVMDAVSMRLLDIGEAVKSLSTDVVATEPDIPWREIAGMRDFLAHQYFSTSTDIVQAVVDKDLPPLLEAVIRLRQQIPKRGSANP